MFEPITVMKKPEEVEAIQFEGWQNSQNIWEWSPNVFYVPRGYEHAFRKDNEFDRGNGHILDEADAFLVVRLGDGRLVRIDRGWWIIKNELGWLSVVSNAMYIDQYVKVDTSD